MWKSKRYLILNLLVCIFYIAWWIAIARLGAGTAFQPRDFIWSYFPLWMLVNIRPPVAADRLTLVANVFVLVTFVITYGIIHDARLYITGYAVCVVILIALTIRRQRLQRLKGSSITTHTDA